MRISSTEFNAIMSGALQDNAGQVAKLMQQMSSRLKLQVPSDDPISSVRLLRMKREEAAIAQYKDNISSLQSQLSRHEAALDGITKDILQVNDLLTWAKNTGANTAQDLRDMARELRTIQASMLTQANQRDQEGNYLYSGTLTTTATIAYDPAAPVGSRYAFAGNKDSQPVVVGNGVTLPGNVTLEEMAPLLNQLDKALGLLESPTLDPHDPVVNTALADAMGATQQGQRDIGSKISGLGSAQNVLTQMADNHDSVSLANQDIIGKLSALDYAQASVDLNSYTLAMQATQKAYSKISGLSLFDAI